MVLLLTLSLLTKIGITYTVYSSEKARAKHPSNTLGYSVVRAFSLIDASLEILELKASPKRRSTTAAKREEKEKKQKQKKT